MIFGDYVAGFLGLGRDGNSWSMNPFDVRVFLFFPDVRAESFGIYSLSRSMALLSLVVRATTVLLNSTYSTAYVSSRLFPFVFDSYRLHV